MKLIRRNCRSVYLLLVSCLLALPLSAKTGDPAHTKVKHHTPAVSGDAENAATKPTDKKKNKAEKAIAKLLAQRVITSAEDITGEAGTNALLNAAAEGKAEQLRLLLAAGVDADTKNEAGQTPHILVCKEQRSDACVEHLLKAGADVNAKDDEGKTALIYAFDASTNYIDYAYRMKLMLQKKPNKETLNAALRKACAATTACVVIRNILDAGADADATDAEGKKAVDYIPDKVNYSNYANRALLKNLHAAPQDKQAHRQSGLNKKEKKHDKVTREQLRGKFATSDDDFEALLHATWPIEKQNRRRFSKPAADKLIDKGILYSAEDVYNADGARAIYEAAYWGHAEILSLLMKAGVDPNVPYYGDLGIYRFAIGRAAIAGHLDCLQILLKEKPSDEALKFALGQAGAGGYVDCLKAALAAKDFSHDDMQWALCQICAHGSIACLEHMLKAGAKCFTPDDKGEAMHWAVDDVHEHCFEDFETSKTVEDVLTYLRMLHKAGADIHKQRIKYPEKTPNGVTVLTSACINKKFPAPLVKFLLEHGAASDVNVKIKDAPQSQALGLTPLMISAQNDHADCIKLLLEAGANANLQDNAGKTALKHAEEKNHTECADLLKAAGTHK